MNLRKQLLPPGWYPQSAEKVREFLETLEQSSLEQSSLELHSLELHSKAVIAPHAGWHYSGRIAKRAFKALKPGADTVVVIGGHLPAGVPPLFAEEDGVVTPLGVLEIDREFRDLIWKEIGGKPDLYYDNTVEVLLPMVKFYFPKARLIWLRLGAEIQSYEAGRIIASIACSLKRRPVLIGSTDLTHYGLNYNFAPRGTGLQALEWVKNENDAAFIQAVLSGRAGAVLDRAAADKSSCSPGAVLACMGYAHALKASKAALLSYAAGAASQEADIPDSFVGYAAMAFFPA
ncbi:MAG: AmmeMemoRadiSam system protein B [Treponema sp.]|jgi:AmmeMemoRadiSam system protein B|nr:AmmeMemoRadiSam system protein B [Treponema sp.]